MARCRCVDLSGLKRHPHSTSVCFVFSIQYPFDEWDERDECRWLWASRFTLDNYISHRNMSNFGFQFLTKKLHFSEAPHCQHDNATIFVRIGPQVPSGLIFKVFVTFSKICCCWFVRFFSLHSVDLILKTLLQDLCSKGKNSLFAQFF